MNNKLDSIYLKFVFILSILSTPVYSQHNSDSLKKILFNSSDIEQRSDAGINLSNIYLNRSFDSANFFIDFVIVDCQASDYPKGLARAKSQKAWNLLVSMQYDKALFLAHEALEFQETDKDTFELGMTLNVLGAINFEYDQLKEAEHYMMRALELFTQIRDTNKIAVTYNNLAGLYNKSELYDKAVYYHKQSREFREIKKDYGRVAYSEYNIATSYLNLKELDSAEVYFNRCVETFKNRSPGKKIPDMVWIGLGEFYIAKKNHRKAIDALHTGIKISEELGHKDRLVWGYDLLSEALHLSGQHEESYLALKKRSMLSDSINKATKASEIAEIENRYQVAETQKELLTANTQNLEKENELIKMRSVNIYIIAGALILILSGIAWNRFKAQAKKIEDADLQSALISSKLTALRSQMNPHFIFNCINTAQSFVINAENEKAYNYLSKFSKLLRRVLENSNLTYTPLEDELELVRLFLSIESYRFAGKFSYEISADQKLEDELYEIPSMIIQPFIENAIIHGINNLEDGHGHIDLKLLKMDTHILCTIEDNGVGRRKALEISQHKQKYFKSQALINIKERLELLNQNSINEVQFNIRDIYNSEGHPTGTKVSVTLPFR